MSFGRPRVRCLCPPGKTQHLLPKSVFDRPGSDRRWNLASTTFPDAEPMVRMRFPPAESRQRPVLPPHAIGCTAPPADVPRKISPRAHGATRPPDYDARYSVILVPIFVRRCSPLPYVPSPVFLLFAAFNRSALRCSSDPGDGLSGLRQAVNSETLNISDCGKRPAGLHSLTRCWWATRLSIACRC